MRDIPPRAQARVFRWSRAVVVAAAACAAFGAAAASPSNGGVTAVRPEQELVTLLTTQQAVSAVLGHTPSPTRTVAARRPVTGTRTVLPVVGHTTAAGVRWLRVLLPGRPNGSTGWITQEGTAPAATIWHLVIRTSSRRVLVYRRGRLVESFAAIVGKPSTPTPHGRFFVEESVLMPRGSAGAPYALALSARSNVLQEFQGGPGQIAIHGVANLGGTPGTAVSHGCIRLDNQSIRWLAARVGPGAPVTIRP